MLGFIYNISVHLLAVIFLKVKVEARHSQIFTLTHKPLQLTKKPLTLQYGSVLDSIYHSLIVIFLKVKVYRSECSGVEVRMCVILRAVGNVVDEYLEIT